MKKGITLFAITLMFFSCKEYSVNYNEVEFDSYKFTVLTNGLISVRASDVSKGDYNYNFDNVAFEVKQNGNKLTVSTDKYSLLYEKSDGDIRNKIKIEFKKNDSLIIE